MQGSVLVVDRDAAMRKLVSGNLRSAGYRVCCASDFCEAESLVRTTRPDVALLDWDPGLPGLTFTSQLRRDRRTAATGIIMLGCRSDEQVTIAALESGADDYVRKPFSMGELLARVKAVLRRRTPELGDEIVDAAGLRLDPAAHRLTMNGQRVELRKTEFKLLHLFMTHRDRAFSRRELLDRVWGDHVFIEERTVDVHVRRLRRRLQSNYGDMLETVRGIGYRMRARADEPATSSQPWTIADFGAIHPAGMQVAPRSSAA